MLPILKLFTGKKIGVIACIIAVCFAVGTIYRSGKEVGILKGNLETAKFQTKRAQELLRVEAKQHDNLAKELANLTKEYEKLLADYRITKLELDTLTPMYQNLHKRYFGTDYNFRRMKENIAEKYNLQFPDYSRRRAGGR